MKKTRKMLFVLLLCAAAPLLSAAGEAEKPDNASGITPFSIAVVVPGVAAGSPIYEQLVAGAERAAAQYAHVETKVVELGFNQAQWAEKLTSIAATGTYDVILTSNPSMPFVSMEVAGQFPDQRFIFVDGFIEGHPQMASFLYNQVEQSYMLGHLAGLITSSSMQGVNEQLKIGFIAAQEYPALNKMIFPGFLEGAQAVDSRITADYRVIGNWYDAAKAGELAKSMIDAGVDVIGVVAGGAAAGVFEAAKQRNAYVMYWDDNAYAQAPGVIAGCGALMQEKLVYEVAVDAVEGRIEYGTARILSARDGYIEFITDDPYYEQTVPAELREQQQALIDAVTAGDIVLEVPEL